ncbi:MAG: guanylate kinase [Kiritimatiellia bacterium]|jgi:guanylate kinase|nr:guanylate kinase [Kiritimatiellia bacterium]MDP6629641.1 guanylate kinase [Kiritimatiellia bacterium]MDP6811085.1 guanylate kinase [Kiritimatiellia bacterium]MDP7024454.1 guanylate kinase [Kiritimatiellia bacterium]
MSKIQPILIIVSAPSGAGKTTLCDRLLDETSNMVYSVSCTTRAPRGEEVDGRSYCFLSEDAFVSRVEAGAFLEHAIVHGHHYGTLRETIESAMANGQSILMDIDVQGAAQIRDALAAAGPDDPIAGHWVDIFISPPSLEALRKRLEGRAEDTPDVIEERLKNADAEMACADAYRYTVINDDLNEAYKRLREIVMREAGGEA